MVSNSISKLNKNRTVPVMIVNNTNKTYKIRQGCALAKLEKKIEDEPVMSLNEGQKISPFKLRRNQCARAICRQNKESLNKDSDIFAEKDSQLGHTNTVKMKINTEDHPPIKLRPYRAPLNNRRVIDEAGTKRPLRRAAFVVPPTDSSADSSDDSSLEESPHKKLAKCYRKI